MLNLTKEQIDELNELLKTSGLNIPEYRKEVSYSGRNIDWLRRNLAKIENIPPRIVKLLKIKRV